MKIGNTEVRLLTKEKLLDMKKAIKPPRDKDLFDIKALEDIMKRNGRGQ